MAILTFLVLLILSSSADVCPVSGAPTPAAFFIFGDSSVDVGNNNYINTTAENRADYSPYGLNGFFKHPTGRFSDGRVVVDFLAEYAKLPLIPPFLQPSADFAKGANFASGGAGILPETHHGLVIDLSTQVRNFDTVREAVVHKVGEIEAKEMLSEAVYLISIGSNDYMGGYLGNPQMQKLYKADEYVATILGNFTQAIQVLYEKGARKFGFISLGPLGCFPALRALNSEAQGGCLEEASAIARAHNDALNSILTSLEHLLPGFKHCNPNFYDWALDRINNPSKYGLKEGVKACCGAGPYRGSFTCGGTKLEKEYELCENPEEYVWWDSFHASQKVHQQFAMDIWSGLGPCNFQDFFINKQSLSIADIVDGVPQTYVS